MGPSGLTGYQLYRTLPGGTREGPLGGVLMSTSYIDTDARPGAVYELVAVNGFATPLTVASTTFTIARGVRVWPAPVSGSGISAQFAPPLDASGSRSVALEAAVFDGQGRRVATLANGPLTAVSGVVTIDWDGRSGAGSRVRPGLYFVRVTAPGYDARGRITVLD